MDEEKTRKYPIRMRPDLSGKVKMETLEAVLIEQTMNDWCSPKKLYEESILGIKILFSEWRCISIRLLRYYRQGLLRRRRKCRGYEYQLSDRGERRLVYFYRKFNCLQPPPGWEFNGRLGELDKELAEQRGKLAIQILEAQSERLKKRHEQLEKELRKDRLELIDSLTRTRTRRIEYVIKYKD
jgi:hypothetical protein